MRFIIEESDRLDKWLAHEFPGWSRTRWEEWIDEGEVLVNGKIEKASLKLKVGWAVDIQSFPTEREAHDLTPISMPLDVLYEDDDLLVVNKPRGLATHPAITLKEPTLVNALLGRGNDLSGGSASFRPGIVHRLDKDTTGLLMVAKKDAAHAELARQIEQKTAIRIYLAVTAHAPSEEKFRIVGPIGRHPGDRLKMAVVADGKPALTHGLLLRQVDDDFLIGLRLETGRTHQIRVHLAHVHCPVKGDELYGGGPAPLQLHASRLIFTHPWTGAVIDVFAPPPDDFLIREVESHELDRLMESNINL